MTLEWNNLRPWNGSQDNAFEELCCQLAACEKCPPGSSFIRKGAPDAGVECYWKFPSGEEIAWQAKFFTTAPSSGQWQQIDESVSTALKKHPSLVQYTICLPCNRSDPRKMESWFQDKWDQRVQKWREWANGRGMSVEFRYWGEFEIFQRLTKDEHSGRSFFWFHKEYLGSEWFKTSLEKVMANAGPRYTPELHIDLPISQVFQGLGRTRSFFLHFVQLVGMIEKKYKTASRGLEPGLQPVFDELEPIMLQLTKSRMQLSQTTIEPIELEKISDLCTRATNLVYSCTSEFRRIRDESRSTIKETDAKSPDSLESRLSYQRNNLEKLLSALYHCHEFAQSHEALLANKPCLLVMGEAGTGKTHLLCDVAKQRILLSQPTIVLLGGHFNNSEPWSQIIKELGLTCRNDEEFLGALDAAGQACGSRALILIDALNEGEGRLLWPKYLGSILTALSRFPHVGIAVSVRSSYERLVIPHDLADKRFVKEVHSGFADHEYDAAGRFFDHYNIQRPSIPILTPEFRNPLFLKTLCKGLSNRGLVSIPDGLDGITAVFNFFVDSVNDKLAVDLKFDPRGRYVQKAVSKLVAQMAEKRQAWISRDEGSDLINGVLPRLEHLSSLFHGLVSEGLLSEDIARLDYDSQTDDVEMIRFSFDRFGDHLMASYLLDKYLEVPDPSASFGEGKVLHDSVKDESAIWQYRGIIEALSIQVPERTKKELTELVPTIKTFEAVQDAFLESLRWRKPQDIGKSALEYINTIDMHSEYSHDQILETLLTVAAKPDHPFNAKFLHENLRRQNLADRDANWSLFLHRQYKSKSSVDRLIDWACSTSDKSYVTDDALTLLAIPITWFLSSSNRFLRDRSTKALVLLLEGRLQVLGTLLQEFSDVNDPYVSERLFAVAYGSSLRSTDREGIQKLAQLVFDMMFLGDAPPPHLLLRDYARGVIEVAQHMGLSLKIDTKKIRPPYKSLWSEPSKTTEELEAEYCPTDWSKDRAFGDIWNSVMGFGDFARYIIGTNSHHFDWSNERLNQRRKPSRKKLCEKFEKSLGVRERNAFSKYVREREMLELSRRGQNILEGVFHYSEAELDSRVSALEKALKKCLSKPQLKRFHEVVIPYLNNPHVDEFAFDLSIAQRWIFERIVQLGWRPELFGEFDSAMHEYSRHPDKAERIGKKYQWIAYHEFLARVSDNFKFRGDTWSKMGQTYQGPWQSYWRDIDPSLLLPIRETAGSDSSWWFAEPLDWQTDLDDVSWLKSGIGMPNIEALIKCLNPNDGTSWLMLEGFFSRVQPAPPDEEQYDTARRSWHLILKSYLVRKRDAKAVFEWAKQQDFMGRWMPESSDLTQVFLREYPWAPSFEYKDTPYFNHTSWSRHGRRGNRTIPGSILVTNDEYLWERGYDCSIEGPIRIKLPSKEIINEMKLHSTNSPGDFIDSDKTVVFMDPSLTQRGPSVLLAREQNLASYLRDKKYEIFWTILGEKNLIGGPHRSEDWKGRLEINGAYRIDSGKLIGQLNTVFKTKN